ncbi:MAG: hypothetical protein BroJett003_03030 [Planctomycetota bacterium]|nr:MAG: hypothetical protein BroJett003_03030 [Planctomycetota bacterium]
MKAPAEGSAAEGVERRLEIDSAFEALLRRNGLSDPEALLNLQGAARLSKRGLASWRERLRVELQGEDGRRASFFLKRYVDPPRSAVRAARRICAAARTLAGVEWTWMRRLAESGIGVPKAVALAEERRGDRELRSAVLITEVPGESLEAWFARGSGSADDIRRRLIAPLASLIRRFHETGHVHRDLYAAHAFVEETVAGPVFRLIDLQRVFRPRWRRRRWIVKDLASLSYSCPAGLVSRAARVRWLKHYLEVSRLRAGDKRLIRSIAHKTRSIARHDARRLRR